MKTFRNFPLIVVLFIAVINLSCLPRRPQTFSLREKIGQMLIVGNKEDVPTENINKQLRSQIESGRISGVLIMGYNIANPTQLKGFIRTINRVPHRLPLLIATDEEGGSTSRLNSRKGYRDFISPRQMALQNSPEQAYEEYLKMAQLLKETGINLNLGPVVDLDFSNSPIGSEGRSFSSDPETVIVYAKKFMEAHRKKGILTVIKHYPGMGSSLSDAHTQKVNVTGIYRDKEMVPFQRMIAETNPTMVMISHIIDDKIDNRPASLSAKHIDHLRNALQYKGIVITDDLYMKAVYQGRKLRDLIIEAVNAGNDLLLFSSSAPRYDAYLPDKISDIMVKAVKDGKIKEERIDESFRKIVKLKESLK